MAKRDMSLAVSAFLIATIFLSPSASQSDEDKGWTMVFGNAQGNCVSESAGPQNPNLELKWAITPSEIIEIGSERTRFGHHFVLDDKCVVQDATGKINIIDITNGNSTFYPAKKPPALLKCVFDDKLLLARHDLMARKDSTTSSLQCLYTENGNIAWELVVPDAFFPSNRVIHVEQELFFIGRSRQKGYEMRLFSIDKSNGDINWQKTLGHFEPDCIGPITSGKGSEFLVCAMTQNNNTFSSLLSFNICTGEKRWEIEDETIYSLASSGDKIIYTTGNKLVCVNNEDGDIAWKITLDEDMADSRIQPAANSKSVFLITSLMENKISCFNLESGEQTWSATPFKDQISGRFDITSMVISDNYLISGTPYCQMVVLDTETGIKLSEYNKGPTEDNIPISPIFYAVAQKLLFVSSNDGKLYCFSSKEPE